VNVSVIVPNIILFVVVLVLVAAIVVGVVAVTRSAGRHS
jgi:hypothetical protein